MATPSCTLCEQYQGAFIFTNLEDGDSPVICLGCAPSFAVGLAAAFTQGITKAQADDMAGALDAIYANDPRKTWVRAAARRGRGKLAAVPALPPDGAESNAETTVDLVPPCPLCGGSKATGDAHKLICDGCGAVIATNPPTPPPGDDDHA